MKIAPHKETFFPCSFTVSLLRGAQEFCQNSYLLGQYLISLGLRGVETIRLITIRELNVPRGTERTGGYGVVGALK